MTPVEFVSVTEAAQALGVSRHLVYDLVHDGQLPALTFTDRKIIRIPRQALDDIVERVMAGFDPDHLLASLAGAGESSSAPARTPSGTGPHATEDGGASLRGEDPPGPARLAALT